MWRNDERFLRAIEVVLRHEVGNAPNGGYVNDPADPGGETKWGISKRSYPHLDIRNLSREDAYAIYYADWWCRYRIREIEDEQIATKVLDMAVLMGPDDAGRYLQISLNALGAGLKVDGVIGSKTVGAANAADSRLVLPILRALAAMHFYNEVARWPASAKFLEGWLKRAYW